MVNVAFTRVASRSSSVVGRVSRSTSARPLAAAAASSSALPARRTAATASTSSSPSSSSANRWAPWSFDPTQPVGDLFSAKTTKLVAQDYHHFLLSRLSWASYHSKNSALDQLLATSTRASGQTLDEATRKRDQLRARIDLDALKHDVAFVRSRLEDAQAVPAPNEREVQALTTSLARAQDALERGRAELVAEDKRWDDERRRAIQDKEVFDIACNILNNNFFLSSLRDPRKPGEYPYLIEKQVVASFGSNTGLEQQLVGTALGTASSGWLWLVQEDRAEDDALAVVVTHGSGTLLAHEGKLVEAFDRLGLTEDGKCFGEPGHPFAYPAMETDDAGRPISRPTLDESALAPVAAQDSSSSSIDLSSDLLQAALDGPSSSSSTADPSLSNPLSPSSSPLPATASYGASLSSAEQFTAHKRLLPLACLSLHEHAYMHDHGVWGKEAYVKAWLRALDWDKVESRMAKAGGGGGGRRYGM